MADPVTTQTVDALLRARSDTNLGARIDDLLAPILAIVADATDPASAQAAVAAFRMQLFGFLQLPRQQQEIASFLSSVVTTDFVSTS